MLCLNIDLVESRLNYACVCRSSYKDALFYSGRGYIVRGALAIERNLEECKAYQFRCHCGLVVVC